MAYQYEFAEVNGTGLDEIFINTAGAVNSFVGWFLFFIYGTVMLAVYRTQRESGPGDIPLCATVAGVVTSTTAILMSIRPELMSLPVLSITIIITIFSAIWFFSSRDR